MDVAISFANVSKYRDKKVSGVLDSHRSVPIELCSVPVLYWATPTNVLGLIDQGRAEHG